MAKVNLQPAPENAPLENYQLRIRGHLTPAWSDVFEGLQLTLTRAGDTLITGPVVDQAALHGLLARIRDLNLTLISIIKLKPGRPSRPPPKRSK